MSSDTLPRARRDYSIRGAAVGARLNRENRRGAEHAKLLWFVILSHTPWDSLTRPTWASNATLAAESGLDERDARRALETLRGAGMLSTPHGYRPGASRPRGRLLAPRLASPVKVQIPSRDEVANLWSTCRTVRKRPASLVTLVVGAYALAAFELDARPVGWARVPVSLADLRRFVGARKGGAWFSRVADLEGLGILRRIDGEVWLAPPKAWDATRRAMHKNAAPDPCLAPLPITVPPF